MKLKIQAMVLYVRQHSFILSKVRLTIILSFNLLKKFRRSQFFTICLLFIDIKFTIENNIINKPD